MHPANWNIIVTEFYSVLYRLQTVCDRCIYVVCKLQALTLGTWLDNSPSKHLLLNTSYTKYCGQKEDNWSRWGNGCITYSPSEFSQRYITKQWRIQKAKSSSGHSLPWPHHWRRLNPLLAHEDYLSPFYHQSFSLKDQNCVSTLPCCACRTCTITKWTRNMYVVNLYVLYMYVRTYICMYIYSYMSTCTDVTWHCACTYVFTRWITCCRIRLFKIKFA